MDILQIDSYPLRGATPLAPGGETASPDARPNPVSKTTEQGRPQDRTVNAEQTREENSREKDIKKVAEGVNVVLAESGNHVRFVTHEKAGRTMIEIRDNGTDEVIRTIPSKELLDLAAKIGEMIGVLVDKKT